MAQETKDRGSRNYDIFTSKIENQKYTKPEKVEYPISTEFYEDCPFISRNERFLIFESNRPGGIGKLDLYISTKDKDGKWTEPINLGNLINSEAEERFPYLSPDGKYFFFGSNRTGNFDIYWINASVIYNTINYSK
jgi:Tol biopolymer transport system component